MVNFFDALVWFLLIHIVCDFYLQPIEWVADKKQKTYRAAALYLHSLLHGALLIAPALILGLDWQTTAIVVTTVIVSHFFIDLWKVKAQKGETFTYFIYDQALHIGVLALIAFFLADKLTFESILKHDKFSDAILIIFGYLFILKPTSIIIGNILKKYPITGTTMDSTTISDNDQSVLAKKEHNVTPSTVSGLAAGGELIGYLERILILTFTLVGSYAAVGFVLAAKSIFRFGELSRSKDRSMTEYVLIGSLVSVVITTLLGALMSLGLDIKIK